MDDWEDSVTAFRAGTALQPPWQAMFEPLRRGAVDDMMVVAQLGQSLDGRVATVTGHSHYINGPDGLAHLHRLRALVDAVVIGVGTAVADDPQLTVRRVSGPQPARVVIDPRGRLSSNARMFADDGVRRLVVTAHGGTAPPAGIEAVPIEAKEGGLSPVAILLALHQRGFRRVLIEGGPATVSRFIVARCLDRLHLVVAPVILGSGRPGLELPPITRADHAIRAAVTTHRLGDETLFDCDLSDQRASIGVARTST